MSLSTFRAVSCDLDGCHETLMSQPGEASYRLRVRAKDFGWSFGSTNRPGDFCPKHWNAESRARARQEARV